MTVLCVNSGVTYSDIASASAAEGSTDYGVPTRFEQTGTSSVAVSFSSGDYPSSLVYTSTDSEKTTGVISVGAQMTAQISGTVSDALISNMRTASIVASSMSSLNLRKLIIDPSGSDGIVFNDTIDAEDIIVLNCDDGFLSSTVLNNTSIVKCTVVGAGRFGYAQGKFNNCVDVDSSNQGFFNESAGSDETWSNDGTGTDSITESTATDIFEDFSAGDYRIKSTSSPGAVGSGAFISSAGGGVTVTTTETLNSFDDNSNVNVDYNVTLDVTESNNPFSDSSTIAVTSGNTVDVSTTETVSAFTDSSTINVSVNVESLVTEVLNSFLDGSNVTIAKDIELSTTEVLASFNDNSSVRLPTNWADKPTVVTNYTTQTPATTIWIDKG